MSALDWFILIPIIWGAYKGFSKGLILELASLLALLVGVYCAFKFSNYATVYLVEYIGFSKILLKIVAFILVFLVIKLSFYLVGKLLEYITELFALGLLNNFLGLIFGIIKYAFIVSFFITFFLFVNNKFEMLSKEKQQESTLFEPISKIAPFVMPVIKESVLFGNEPTPKSL